MGVAGGTSGDPAAQLERDRQASQALQDASQERFGAAIGAANSYTP